MARVSIITLTTDLGTKDFYLASVKAKIIEQVPSAKIIDITNEIEPFNVVLGAFQLASAYRDFPNGSIHLFSIDTSLVSRRHLIAKKRDQYFIGPDNGAFSIAFPRGVDKVWEIIIDGDDSEMLTFPLKELYIKLAAFIITGGDISDICQETNQIAQLVTLQPIQRGNIIQGSVVYIDNYRNVFVNVSRDYFTEVGVGRPFKIHYRRKDFIDYTVEDYSQVPEGEVLALFGNSGYLEIAINKDRAADLLGLQIGTPIQIEFI